MIDDKGPLSRPFLKEKAPRRGAFSVRRDASQTDQQVFVCGPLLKLLKRWLVTPWPPKVQTVYRKSGPNSAVLLPPKLLMVSGSVEPIPYEHAALRWEC